MIRVLIVDDSPTVRAVIRAILQGDPDMEVVGEADSGRDAIRLALELHPDVVTMDILMPGMDGLEATREIMIQAPTRIIIVSSQTDVHEVRGSLQALRLGALSVLPTPCGNGSPRAAADRAELLRTVRSMSTVGVIRHWRGRSEGGPPVRRAGTDGQAATRCEIVAIAASTGGPAALQRVSSGLPADYPLPILVVQHMPEGFMQGLADWLGSTCPLRVKIAAPDEALAPHGVYLAPDSQHLGLGVGRSRLALSSAPAVGGFRPSATFLFESVARVAGAAGLGIILTGMGRDGVDGLRALRAAGGRVVAQDRSTSVVYGMPREAVAEGLAHAVLPLGAIRWELMEAAAHDYAVN